MKNECDADPFGPLLLDLGNGDAIHIDNWDQENPLSNQTFASFQFADGTSLGWSELLARGSDLDGTAGDDLNAKTRRVGAGKTAMDRKFNFHLHRRHGTQAHQWRVTA